MNYPAMPIDSSNGAKSGIYQIRNKIDGKLYVGSAVRLANRWCVHRYGLTRGRHHSIKLQRAWTKYGSSSFVFEVIQIVENHELLLASEQQWLDKLNVVADGYNITPTAGSTLGRVLSDASKAKMAEKKRGIKRTPEARARQSASTAGVTHSPEHRAKLTAINRARAGSTSVERARLAAIKKEKSKQDAILKRLAKAVFAICKVCVTKFRTRLSYIAKGGGKYCCQACYRADRGVKLPAWNYETGEVMA